MRRSAFSSAPLWGIALGLGVLAHPVAAQPVIEVTPTTFDLPYTTLGDTVSASLNIGNVGTAPLTVSAIDLPPGVELRFPPPYVLPPDSVLKTTLLIAPLDTITAQLRMTIHSDDPVNPAVTVGWENRGLALMVETLALGTATPFPLGEPIVVETVPLDGVNIERMTLFFRSGGTTNYQPLVMTRNVRAFIGIIPGVSVLEGGVEYYVQVENSQFINFDPLEGDRRPFRIDIGSPEHYTLSAVYRNPGLTWRVGESIDFILTLGRGTVFESGTLWYRAGGDTVWSSVNILEMSFTGIAATIPATSVGPTGVQYWSEITTLTTRMTDPQETPGTRPIEIRVSIENLVEPDTHPAERYRLFSVPMDPPGATSLGTMLSDESEFGAYDPVKWRAFRYLPGLGANLELPSATAGEFDVVPGRAFWLISKSAHQVNTAPIPGVSTRLTDPLPVVLAPGWNAIGNPFGFPIPWSVVRYSVAVGEPVAFDPARNDYSEEAPEMLEPFEGYFIENTSTVPETLLIPSDPRGFKPPSVADGAQAKTAHAGVFEFGWRLEARGAGGADLANLVGVSVDAAPERDLRDAGEPPPSPDSRVRLAIANRGWSQAAGLYRRDFRPPADGNAWEFEVASRTAGDPVEVLIRPHGEVPDGLELRLVDQEQGSTLEPVFGLDGAFRHTILSTGRDRPYRLTLIAGSADFVDRVESTAGLPERVTLDPVVPNPARGALRLRFGLPRAAAVRLEVFDVTGQRVATLLEGGTLSPGFHAVVWQGARGGTRAASGMYYFRLTAGVETRVVRAVMIQ